MTEQLPPPWTRARAEAEALDKAAEALGKVIGPTLWPGHRKPAAKAAVTAYMEHLAMWTQARRAHDEAIMQTQIERVNHAFEKSKE